jgi:hypothetical protein
MRTQKVGESLQDFATVIEQLNHLAYNTFPEDHIRREAGKAFVDRVEDSLPARRREDTEALRQTLQLHAVLIAAMSPKTKNGASQGPR